MSPQSRGQKREEDRRVRKKIGIYSDLEISHPEKTTATSVFRLLIPLSPGESMPSAKHLGQGADGERPLQLGVRVSPHCVPQGLGAPHD